MIKVSVVLPVYNVASYLARCLDTLRDQTLKEIEIICVDDGSSDDTPQILQVYAAADDRIKVINQKNAGPGVARNRGIAEAAGEYIAFVDPDDWVDADMFEKMYAAAKEHDADVVECGVMTHQEKGGKTKAKSGLPGMPAGKIFNCGDIPAYLFTGITAGWNKLCRRSLLEDKKIRYSAGRCAEDHLFTTALRLSAPRVFYIDEPLYHYFIRGGSLTQHLSRHNLDVPLFLRDVGKLLEEEGAGTEIKALFINDAAGLAAIHYNKTPHEDRDEYKRRCRECLPEESFKLFEKFVRPYRLKEKIFSVRFKTKGTQKYRVVTLLGITLKFKV